MYDYSDSLGGMLF